MKRFRTRVLAIALLASIAGASAQGNALAAIADRVRLAPFHLCLGYIEERDDDVLSFLYAGSEPDRRMRACLVTDSDARWRSLAPELPGWSGETPGDDVHTGTWRDPTTDPSTNYRAAAIGSMGRDYVAVVADRYAPLVELEPAEYASAVGDAADGFLERHREIPASDCTSAYDPGTGFMAFAPAPSLASCTVTAEIEQVEGGIEYAYEIRYGNDAGETDVRRGGGFVMSTD